MNEQLPLFSIVTVCLNPGKDLPKTVESVLSQTFHHFEYIIKDGVSQDGMRDFDCSDPRVTFVSQPDDGIYDAMNQALDLCAGQYVIFLNAGDTFRVRNALSEVANLLKEKNRPDFVYVDRYNEKLDAVTHYPSSLSPWYLYRRPVCHQVLFVKRSILLHMRGFDTSFQILADYDVLMRLVLTKKASHIHCSLVGVNYKDDGVSSNLRNHQQKMNELRRLRKTYFTWIQRVVYGIIWRITLPGIRIRLIHQDRIKWLRRILCR